MKSILNILLITAIVLCTQFSKGYSQANLSDLLDGDPDYPLVMPQENLFIVTSNQMNLIVTYLEDRVNLKLQIKDLAERNEIKDLTAIKQMELSEKDKNIISGLVEVNKLKERETITKLNGIDYKVQEVNLFLGKERDELISKNKRLKTTLWSVIGVGVVTGVILSL